MDLRPGYSTATGWNDLSVNLPASSASTRCARHSSADRDRRRAAATTARSSSTTSRSTRQRGRDAGARAAAAGPADLARRRARGRDWSFATLSDIQFTAADPDAGQGRHRRAQADPARPTPTSSCSTATSPTSATPADIALARKTLEAGGCDLIEAGGRPPDADPDDRAVLLRAGQPRVLPPSGQGTLDPFGAEFGAPYRTFDHKGTRFVLLNSRSATLRGSDFGAAADAPGRARHGRDATPRSTT